MGRGVHRSSSLPKAEDCFPPLPLKSDIALEVGLQGHRQSISSHTCCGKSLQWRCQDTEICGCQASREGEPTICTQPSAFAVTTQVCLSACLLAFPDAEGQPKGTAREDSELVSAPDELSFASKVRWWRKATWRKHLARTAPQVCFVHHQFQLLTFV